MSIVVKWSKLIPLFSPVKKITINRFPPSLNLIIAKNLTVCPPPNCLSCQQMMEKLFQNPINTFPKVISLFFEVLILNINHRFIQVFSCKYLDTLKSLYKRGGGDLASRPTYSNRLPFFLSPLRSHHLKNAIMTSVTLLSNTNYKRSNSRALSERV